MRTYDPECAKAERTAPNCWRCPLPWTDHTGQVWKGCIPTPHNCPCDVWEARPLVRFPVSDPSGRVETQTSGEENDMTTKLLEVRDSMTRLPVLAMKPETPHNEAERWLWGVAGFGDPTGRVFVTKLDNAAPFTSDPFKHDDHGTRTMKVAHQFIAEHWDELAPGDVVDVEFILGETMQAKTSDRLYGQDLDVGELVHDLRAVGLTVLTDEDLEGEESHERDI